MTKPKRKKKHARIRPSRRKAVKAAKQAVSGFVPSPDIIRRTVTVEEAVQALEKRGAMWPHDAERLNRKLYQSVNLG